MSSPELRWLMEQHPEWFPQKTVQKRSRIHKMIMYGKNSGIIANPKKNEYQMMLDLQEEEQEKSFFKKNGMEW